MIYYSTDRDKPIDDLLSIPLEPIDPTVISVRESGLFAATLREAEETRIPLFESVTRECDDTTNTLEDAERSIKDYGDAKERESRDEALERKA